MTESFAELFEESLSTLDMTPGAIISAVVVSVDNDFVTVNAGLKSEGFIPRIQFIDANGELSVEVGDSVSVALESVEDGYGHTRLSREKAKRAEKWASLEQAFANEDIVTGVLTQSVRGGFSVMLDNVQAFLPGSLLDLRPLRDSSHLLNQQLEFKLVKLDARRNNIVVSRKAVLEEEFAEERGKLLEKLDVGVVLQGIVKNITDYGAFIDLGGIDGLLHITDIAWKRVKHPSQVLTVGDEIDVKVIRYDREKNRISLGVKQLTTDPWQALIAKYKVGHKYKAKVTNLTDYGCFAEIADGVEGLVHMSEMDWTNKNVQPSKVVQQGDQVDVMILSIDQERRRISLGMKQCADNPWQLFADTHKPGDHFIGNVRSITDFGLFVSLDNSIDGLVHVTDLSWRETGEQALKRYKKGDQVETVILSIDQQKERVALGIKQLDQDLFDQYCNEHSKGSIVTGTVHDVDSRQATIELAENVMGLLRVAEADLPSGSRLEDVYGQGTKVESMIMSLDKRQRLISLSVRKMTAQQAHDSLSSLNKQSVEQAGPTTIGDLIRAQMEKDS